MIKLENEHRQVLCELSLNARAKVVDLATKLNMSKQMVSYYLREMEKSGIIRRYFAITNIYMLGKTHYRILAKFQNISSEVEEELRNFLLDHPKIPWLINLEGDFDILFVVWAENIIEFEKVYDAILSRYGIYFHRKNFSIATRIEYLPYNFLRKDNLITNRSFVFGDGFVRHDLDKLDRVILSKLNSDGRLSLKKIAECAGASVKLVKKRISLFQEKGIIIGFHYKIDHRLIGYTYRKVLLVLHKTSSQELANLSGFLQNQKSVIYLLKTIGAYDFEFELMTESSAEFYDLIRNLRHTFKHNIKAFNSVIMSDEPKDENLVLNQ